MKTSKKRTQCPAKSGTFASNRHEFCRKKRLCDDNLPVQFGFSRFFSCIIRGGIAARHTETAMLTDLESLAATLHPALSFLCDTP